MTENIQQISVLKLITICAEKINLQHVLYLLAFLIFGIGDGITSAYMIDMRGVAIEANPIMRFLFITQGFEGMILAKVWFTFAMLLAVYIVQLRSPAKMYWSVNGFLIALIIGGSMAVNANLNALAGEVPSGPGGILFTYIVLALILIEIGDNVDKRTAYTGNIQRTNYNKL